MIVVDASAVVAILFREISADRLAQRLAEETDKVMSVASYLEAGTVLAGRRRSPDRLAAVKYLDAFVDEADIRLAAVDVPQIRLALDARIRFGRGMGTGHTLNFGDSFSYALAKALGAPLLFVGRDFSKTDIVPALPESEF